MPAPFLFQTQERGGILCNQELFCLFKFLRHILSELADGEMPGAGLFAFSVLDAVESPAIRSGVIIRVGVPVVSAWCS